MDDRIAEIREALDWWEDHGLARFSQREIDPVVDAARAYADLLDSDALIIRRDEAEKVDDALRSLVQRFNPPADMSINEKVAWREGVYYAIDFISDALASSQGVEPPPVTRPGWMSNDPLQWMPDGEGVEPQ